MPDFANIRKAFLRQGEPACVPPLEFSVDKAIQTQWLGREPKTIDDQAEFFLGAGYDFVPVDFGMPRLLFQQGGTGGWSQAAMNVAEGHYGANRDRTSTRVWAEQGAGLITDEASFDNFDWPDPDQEPYHDVARLGEILPREAKVIPLLGYVFAGSWMLMGFERFCLDLADGGDLAARVVRKIGRFHCRVAENLLQFDCVGAVCMPDDVAYSNSLMVRPSFLRKHIFPWHKKIGQMVHAKDLPYLFHGDGRNLPIIDDLIACGYNALHPCEPASMDIVELKRSYGDRLCLCGNINLDSTLTRGTPQDVEEEVKLRIRTVGPGGGYCCGSSNSVTEYVPLDNYRAMLEATRKYGTYPIHVR